MVAQATTPPKSDNKSKPEHKKYKKKHQPEEDEPEVLEFVEDEEEDTELKVIPPGGAHCIGYTHLRPKSDQRKIVKTKLVRKGQLFHLSISSIQRPPIDLVTGRRALEIREPHSVHVENFKSKMLLTLSTVRLMTTHTT